MRAIIQFLICCTIFGQLYAQQNTSDKHLSKKGNATWQLFEESERVPASQLVKNKTLLKLGAKDELKPVWDKADKTGMRHYRYQQMHNGVPVEWAVYLMHEKNACVTYANGSLIQGLNIPTIPSISEATALQSALEHTNAALYAWEDDLHEHTFKHVKQNAAATFYPSGELVIIDPQLTQQVANCRLAYKFDIYAVQPLNREVVYIDAHSGEVLKTMEKIHSCTDIPATGETNYSGTVDFTACYADDEYTLKNNRGGGMQVFDAGSDISLLEIPCHDPDGHFDTDATATEVHWATEKTYEYLWDTHGRNSIDSSGAPLLSWVHFGDQLNNAYWNGAWMLYGDGDGTKFSSFTSPDIVAHEIIHGLTDHTSNLIYEGEPGALNESFSDIFGEVIERYIRGSNDWIVGADFTLAPKNGLRNMADPNDPNVTTRQPDTYLGDYYKRNNYSVHTNSGIQNHWFYLLAEGGIGINDNDHSYDIAGIGMEKTTAIAYLNLITLPPNANFEDARIGAIQAAEYLYGADEAIQTDSAWCAVGVGPGCVREDYRMRDSLALVALYNSTNGANWSNTWNLMLPMNTWYGVTLNEEGRVICIDMDGHLSCNINAYGGNGQGNFLIGNIPPEIGNLSNLSFLSLGNNYLIGNILSEIGNLSSLEMLDLSSNQLSGSIPVEIGNLNKLKRLHLSNNYQLGGIIPPEIGNLKDLKRLDLSYNELIGIIPPEIENLNELNVLDLHSNQLSGIIPPEIGNLNELGVLNLSYNELSGIIPPEIGNLNSSLDLSYNQLSGCFDFNLALFCPNLLLAGNNFIVPWENFCNYGVGACSSLPYFNCSDDSLALVTLYYATNGNQWANPWNLEEPMHTWHGVTSMAGCVIKLNLYNNDLSGSIPSEIGNLNNLGWLSLARNNLSGNIPPEIGNLNNLERLSLYGNYLSDSIPPEIGNLNNLERLSSHSNQLSGNIPPEIGNLNNLEWLDLYSNQLSGNIPPEIGNLNNLGWLYLLNNQLSGSIPSEIGNLNNLGLLDLRSNDLIGNIPPEIGNLNNLVSLALSGNTLDGDIPPEIGNLSRLYQLWLNSCGLSGSIPPEIGNLSGLHQLWLSNNQLSGSIPVEIGNLNNLEDLWLSNNQLSGSIPVEIGNLNNLEDLLLSSNQLSGSIPPEIGNLNNLKRLYLSSNALSGSIPPEIGNLNNLERLDLSSNQLSGSIPSEIGNLNNLERLDLSSNELSGCFHQNLSGLCDVQIIVGEGNNFDATWEDFCMDESGICPPSPVLPGDFNNDGIADKTDLIYWGLAEGYTGYTRPDATTAWISQDSPEWDVFIARINSKHQDADGNGIINEADLAVLDLNYGGSYGELSYTYNASPAIYTLQQVDIIVDTLKQVTYELHLQANTTVNTHGISGSVEFNDSPTISEIRIDTTGSVLQPTHYIERYEEVGNTRKITFALTRTDKSNRLIDGYVVKLVVMDEDVQVVDPIDATTNGGMMMSATGIVTTVTGSTLQGSLDGANPTLPVFLAVNDAYCNGGGTAEVFVSEGTAPYTYMWSTGETSSRINDLDIGSYSVTVNDATDLETVIDSVEINWAFIPVEVITEGGQICFDFEETPLSESVEVSLDNGLTYMSPITENTCYSISEDMYQVWIRLISDTCAIHLADIDIQIGTDITSTYENSLDVQLIDALGHTPQLLCNLTEPSVLHVDLYNAQGQLVRELHKAISVTGEYQIDIDKSNLPKGIYLIHIRHQSDGYIRTKTLKILI